MEGGGREGWGGREGGREGEREGGREGGMEEGGRGEGEFTILQETWQDKYIHVHINIDL